MGLASSIGLGSALARPERGVLAIDGDGAVLMNLGTLATIADQSPENYLLVIIDNGVYGSTGGQPTCTSREADLASIARGAGNRDVSIVEDLEGLRNALRRGRSGVVVVKVLPGLVNAPHIERSPRHIHRPVHGRMSATFPVMMKLAVEHPAFEVLGGPEGSLSVRLSADHGYIELFSAHLDMNSPHLRPEARPDAGGRTGAAIETS